MCLQNFESYDWPRTYFYNVFKNFFPLKKFVSKKGWWFTHALRQKI